jgi:type 1 fimbria pilin
MKRTLYSVFAALLMTAAVSGAQGPHGGRTSGTGTPQLDMSKVCMISGTVASVHIAYGAQYPSITVDQFTIKVAPVWYMLEKGFEVKAGDRVSVAAAPSTRPDDSYLYAVEMSNTATGARILLRDSFGIPLWTSGPGSGSGSSNGVPSGAGTGCIDPTSIAQASGTVEKVNAGAGIQMPTLTLKTVTGALLTVKIGPERILLDSDFELKPGDAISVKYGRSTCSDEYLAISLTNAAGVTIVLRNDDGTPDWN